VERVDVKKPFGTSVKAWRGRLGISQEELAGRAGLHRTYVCDIERGARNVSLQSIEKLARALEISVATLFAYQAPPGGSGSAGIGGGELVDILFVEDNPNDIELAMEALQFITNRVQVIRNGLDAVDFLFRTGAYAGRPPTRRPQLILLDLGLPGLGGLEVLRRVKSDPRTASIPVVVLTASNRDRDIQTSKRLGAAAYIAKPVDLRNLSGVAPGLSLQWALLKPAAPARRIRATSGESATS
jgi:CheY-like chemotaxis protein/DNA-binding Xre family transcriptional regulator